jgi:hypothetical protein
MLAMAGGRTKPARIVSMALDRPLVPAPEFPPVEWLNVPAPPGPADLRGQVALVDVWDFTCLNCLRTLPTLRDWHVRYQDAGLAMIGVHTPEFPFGHDRHSVRSAIGRLGIRWPVALDNHREIWTLFANRVWPTVYLVDRAGCTRFRREGEGGTFELESALRALLAEAGPQESLLPPRLTSDGEQAGGVYLPVTPDLRIEAVGNGPVRDDGATLFAMPGSREEGAFYFQGSWRAVRRGLALESEVGEVRLPFQASAVHAVLAAGGDPNAAGSGDADWLEAFLDGARVEPKSFGRDLQRAHESTGIRVGAARSYDILQSVGPGVHELRLCLASPGTILFAFAFDAGLEPSTISRSATC